MASIDSANKPIIMFIFNKCATFILHVNNGNMSSTDSGTISISHKGTTQTIASQNVYAGKGRIPHNHCMNPSPRSGVQTPPQPPGRKNEKWTLR